MKKLLFEGCATAIATPFTDTGVNYDEFAKFIDFQINEGIDEERKETFRFAIQKVAKRIPVIIGTGSNNTKSAIELTKYAESIGADGALVVTPYYNKTTQERSC